MGKSALLYALYNETEQWVTESILQRCWEVGYNVWYGVKINVFF
jgi:hypothetical protein